MSDDNLKAALKSYLLAKDPQKLLYFDDKTYTAIERYWISVIRRAYYRENCDDLGQFDLSIAKEFQNQKRQLHNHPDFKGNPGIGKKLMAFVFARAEEMMTATQLNQSLDKIEKSLTTRPKSLD